jgi:hypothetical protein
MAPQIVRRGKQWIISSTFSLAGKERAAYWSGDGWATEAKAGRPFRTKALAIAATASVPPIQIKPVVMAATMTGAPEPRILTIVSEAEKIAKSGSALQRETARKLLEHERQRQRAFEQKDYITAGEHHTSIVQLWEILRTPQRGWSDFHAQPHWLKVFARDGMAISPETFNKMVDDGAIRLKPGATTKSISVAIDDLPESYNQKQAK